MKKTTVLTLCALIGALILSTGWAAGAVPALRYAGLVRDYGLRLPVDLATDVFGQHLYVAGAGADTLTVFEREAFTGKLHVVEKHIDGSGAVQGLAYIHAVTVSDDVRSVYAVALNDDALTVFSRDPNSGKLTHLETHRDTVDSVHGLDGPSDVVVSPDGANVYVAAQYSDAIALFERDPFTGRLTFKNAIYDEAGPVPDGLDGVYALAFNPDGDYLYSGSIEDDAVCVFHRNPASGNLTFEQLHVAGAGGIERQTKVRALAVSRDGGHLYAVASDSNVVNIFALGSTSGLLTYQGQVRDSYDDVYDMSSPTSLAISPFNGQVYVGSVRALHVFRRDTTSGALTLVQRLTRDGNDGLGLSSVNSILVSPFGNYLYTAATTDSTIGIYHRHAGSGLLASAGGLQNVDKLDGVVGLATSSNGYRLFVSSPNSDSLVVFARDPRSGSLTSFQKLTDGVASGDGLKGARDVVPSGTQDFYAAAYDEDAISHFRLSAIGTAYHYQGMVAESQPDVYGLEGPQALALSADRRFLYVASAESDALTVLGRDPDSGEIEFVQFAPDGAGPNRCLNGAYDLAISPDGGHIYVASIHDNAVAQFTRDPADGTVAFASCVQDNGSGATGLQGANGLAISPDGRHLLVAGRTAGTLSTWRLDPDSGDLQFRGMSDPTDFPGMEGARAVTISPNGRRVYVAAQYSHSVVVLALDPESGVLSYLETERDGQHGVDGLRTANGLALSPDGQHLYVAGYGDDAVAIFSTRAAVYLPLVLR